MDVFERVAPGGEDHSNSSMIKRERVSEVLKEHLRLSGEFLEYFRSLVNAIVLQ
jgi:hypothetical protein